MFRDGSILPSRRLARLISTFSDHEPRLEKRMRRSGCTSRLLETAVSSFRVPWLKVD